MTTCGWTLGVSMIAAAAILLAPAQMRAQQPAPTAVVIGADDIGGIVRSANGPESGVWVIAETRDLPTKFIKIVVTDDQGRYVMPELPRRATTCGCAAMGLLGLARRSRASPARRSISAL